MNRLMPVALQMFPNPPNQAWMDTCLAAMDRFGALHVRGVDIMQTAMGAAGDDCVKVRYGKVRWWAVKDSNLQPTD